jgi:DNA-binding transcriptional MerR regulator
MSDNGSVINDEIIPIPSRKMYYSISEVTQMTGLEQSVLRHWEKEFSKLRPKKNSAGKRTYREKDIELIRRIKQLLYNERYTIHGAIQKIAEERKAEAAAGKRTKTRPDDDGTGTPTPEQIPPPKNEQAPSIPPDTLEEIRKELRDVLAVLEG